MGDGQGDVGGLILHLLDSAQGHPIQSWTFRDCARVRIGRAADNDVSLADQRVSRLHVELVYQDNAWLLLSQGRNGTWINGALVHEFRLSDHSIFQLGSNGPSLQVGTASTSAASKPTINTDVDSLDFLVIDQRQKEAEVQQIMDSEAFQQLQQQVRRLKHGGYGE